MRLCVTVQEGLTLPTVPLEGRLYSSRLPGHLVPVEQFRDALLLVAAYSLPAVFPWKEQGQSFAACLVPCTAQPSQQHLTQQSHLLSCTENHSVTADGWASSRKPAQLPRPVLSAGMGCRRKFSAAFCPSQLLLTTAV